VDHIKPVAKGGGDELSNLAVTHPACNMRKG
jgi:5-methylcytosine-specific restriction endonuclease McrA